MVNIGTIIAAVLGLGGLVFLLTAKKEGVSVGGEIGELGKGVGELGLGIGRAVGGALGTPAFTLIEVLRGIFQLGADIQGIPREKAKGERSGERPPSVLPPGYQPPIQRESYKPVIEVGDIAEVIAGSDIGQRGLVALSGNLQAPWRVGFIQNVFTASQLREIQDVRAGARAV